MGHPTKAGTRVRHAKASAARSHAPDRRSVWHGLGLLGESRRARHRPSGGDHAGADSTLYHYRITFSYRAPAWGAAGEGFSAAAATARRGAARPGPACSSGEATIAKVHREAGMTLPTELLAAIGEVATRWSQFEMAIDAGIWLLVNADLDDTACLTAQIGSSGRKLEALLALMTRKGFDPTLLKQVRSLAERAGGLQRQRNRVVHDVWLSGKQTGRPFRLEVSAAKTAVFESRSVTLAEMKKLSDDIFAHTMRLVAVHRALIDWRNAHNPTAPKSP